VETLPQKSGNHTLPAVSLDC